MSVWTEIQGTIHSKTISLKKLVDKMDIDECIVSVEPIDRNSCNFRIAFTGENYYALGIVEKFVKNLKDFDPDVKYDFNSDIRWLK